MGIPAGKKQEGNDCGRLGGTTALVADSDIRVEQPDTLVLRKQAGQPPYSVPAATRPVESIISEPHVIRYQRRLGVGGVGFVACCQRSMNRS